MSRARVALLCCLVIACSRPNMAVLKVAPTTHAWQVFLGEKCCTDSLELTYLGVGGFLLRRQGQAIMTAPSFTHRGLLRTMLPWPFQYLSDTALIDARLRGLGVDDVSAILVGHSHYDHLADVPYVARRWTPRATIHGSRTMAHTLAGDAALRSRTHGVADSAAGPTKPGRWIYPPGGGVRFMAIESSHAPNLGRFTFAEGHLERDRTSLPRTARGWLEGEVYAYLIDVIAPDSTPVFRIYYQDAAADSQHVGIPMTAAADLRPIDIAIMTVGNYQAVANNPQVLIESVKPTFVILSHWEDFFRGPDDPLAVIPGTDTEELMRRIGRAQRATPITPRPMQKMIVRFGREDRPKHGMDTGATH